MTKNKKDHLKLRHLVLIILLSLFFVSYPGASFYLRLFSYHRDLFTKAPEHQPYIIKPVPVVINQFLQPKTSAQGVYIIDLDSATPIYSKNERQRFLPASTAKIISALVALDYFDIDAGLKVKRSFEEGQVVGFIPGDIISFENVLYALLVHSGNDAAYLLVDNFPGEETAFVAAMNTKAVSLGMNNTQFKNPAGLDAQGQYTTGFDLSLAARKLLQNHTLARIVSVQNITISDIDFNHFYHLSNVNKLLGEIPGIGGLKTGFTEEAGENLVTFYKKNAHQFLIVILKSEDRFEDTRNIVEWINSNIKFIDI